MTRTRNLSDLLDSNGDVKSDALDNTSSDLVDDTTPQLGGNLDVNSNSIVSTSNGDINITPNGTGSVVLDGLSYPQADGTNGQFMTTDGSGNLSFGDVTSVGGATGVDFNDSVKARFGTGNDLEIYHDGYSSKIVETGTGSLQLGGTSSVDILSGDLGEYLARFHDDGKVELRYDNTVRLETTSTGVAVTGDLQAGDSGNGSFKAVSGTYGSVEIDGGAHSGWEGYSIGGRSVFMHNNNVTTGIYNDVDNQWVFSAAHNGEAHVYHAGTSKAYAGSFGWGVNGAVWGYSEGSNNLRVNLTQGSAKFWTNIDGTGTVNSRDSYNVSSVTDVTTGVYRPIINNDMNSASWSASCISSNEAPYNISFPLLSGPTVGGSGSAARTTYKTAGQCQIRNYDPTSYSSYFTDKEDCDVQGFGDLA